MDIPEKLREELQQLSREGKHWLLCWDKDEVPMHDPHGLLRFIKASDGAILSCRAIIAGKSHQIVILRTPRAFAPLKQTLSYFSGRMVEPPAKLLEFVNEPNALPLVMSGDAKLAAALQGWLLEVMDDNTQLATPQQKQRSDQINKPPSAN